MRIRAITIGHKIPNLYSISQLEGFLDNNFNTFYKFYADLIKAFTAKNISVESKRFCSQPLFYKTDQLTHKKSTEEILSLLENYLDVLQLKVNQFEIDYFSCTSIFSGDLDQFSATEKILLGQIDNYVKKYPKFFTSLPIISKNGICLDAIKTGAKIIKSLSVPDPFNNLKFCISCQVPPNTPFFPASYHIEERPGFSIALEMADEVLKIFENANNLQEAKVNLKKKFNEIYNTVTDISQKVAKMYKIKFEGIDFSPAPYPVENKSIGTALESLGIDYFGAYGTLTGIALITNSIPRKKYVIGFSGFMQPLFEDFILSKRLSENKFNMDSLLLYSTLCGTGIDCVPLPGDISERELFYILLDLSTISIIHNKPLTARLMPIPGKKAGDDVKFDFEYFAPTKVIEIRRLLNSNKKNLFAQKESSLNFL